MCGLETRSRAYLSPRKRAFSLVGRRAWKVGSGMLVPSRGWTVVLRGVVNVAQFGLLGPFFRGQWIERVEIGARTNAQLTGEFGLVLTPSDNASLESWQSGSPIIQRSTMSGDGQPVWAFALGNANFKTWRFAVGRRIEDTPQYLVCRLVGSHAVSLVDAFFTAFCLEEYKER